MRFAKGHGTGNDFVILPDPGGRLDLTPELVAALCDRHFGIGADGVLRVVRTGAAGEDAAGQRAEWFMDYRNADGSIAEMCGNGIRVFAKYLLDGGPGRGTGDRDRDEGRHADCDARSLMGSSPSIWVLPRCSATARCTLAISGWPGWRSRWAIRTWPA